MKDVLILEHLRTLIVAGHSLSSASVFLLGGLLAKRDNCLMRGATSMSEAQTISSDLGVIDMGECAREFVRE